MIVRTTAGPFTSILFSSYGAAVVFSTPSLFSNSSTNSFVEYFSNPDIFFFSFLRTKKSPAFSTRLLLKKCFWGTRFMFSHYAGVLKLWQTIRGQSFVLELLSDPIPPPGCDTWQWMLLGVLYVFLSNLTDIIISRNQLQFVPIFNLSKLW